MQQDRIQSRWRTVLIIALIFAALFFLYRGPWLGITGGVSFAHGLETAYIDFSGRYAASRALLAGDDPYDMDVRRHHLTQAGAPEGRRLTSPAYPPSTFIVLIPFAVFPWAVAAPAFVVSGMILMLFSAFLIHRWLELHHDRNILLLFWISVLLFAPGHIAIKWSNPALLAGTLAIIGLVCAAQRFSILGGLLLGIGIAVKPQICAPLIGIFLVQRDWRALSAATATGLGLMIIGIGLMSQINPHWWDVATQTAATMPGHADESYRRLARMDLAPLIQDLVGTRQRASFVALLTTGIIGILWLVVCFKRGKQDDPIRQLLVIVPLLSLTMLPIYHKTHDAVILLPILGLAWSILIKMRISLLPIMLLIALVPYMIMDWSTAIMFLYEKNYFPAIIFESTIFQHTLLTSKIWSTLFFIFVPLWLIKRSSKDSGVL